MRKTTALLLLIAAAFPGASLAQIKAGVVGEAGLGITAAPVPALGAAALALSPAALTAATLSPSLLAPSLGVAPALAVAVAAQPAAAKPVIAAPVAAAARVMPTALASIKSAAATPDKPGSGEALAAGSALFDGAAKLSAPAIGDWFNRGSKDGGKRASGLSPPTETELADAYREAQPQSKAIELLGRDFVAAAAHVVQKYTFMGDYLFQELDPRAPGFKAAADIVKTHETRDSEPARRFMQLLGRWFAFKDHAEEAAQAVMMRRMGRAHAPHLPPSPIPGGEYWDMAAGMNAQGFINRELDPGTNYSFFDYSPFVVSYLTAAAELKGVGNAAAVEGDINKLAKPAKPLAVLRTKNAVHYVPGFDKKLEEMVDWIAPAGQLVIQNDPGPGQRSLILSQHGPVIRRLLAEGWAIEYGFSGYEGKWGEYALDTLVLTRPKKAAARSAQDADTAWKAYAAAVARIDADFNPFAFLFR